MCARATAGPCATVVALHKLTCARVHAQIGISSHRRIDFHILIYIYARMLVNHLMQQFIAQSVHLIMRAALP